MLFLDGIYIGGSKRLIRFHRLEAPTGDELSRLTFAFASREARHLERGGLLVRDTGQSYLTSNVLGGRC